jgi:hypothetical protein
MLSFLGATPLVVLLALAPPISAGLEFSRQDRERKLIDLELHCHFSHSNTLKGDILNEYSGENKLVY